ncbi:hypothetical protein Vadar_025978 [Vaccinium darrowii]|uniref:Uncharacterized protein n=1 Tax=Vaccinium darrowii TaxID=229202 RepID=A0ACB7YQV3_9ERIC|nr:hypothetical protein Vadar_025978 [Vaccinium darrowii]
MVVRPPDDEQGRRTRGLKVERGGASALHAACATRACTGVEDDHVGATPAPRGARWQPAQRLVEPRHQPGQRHVGATSAPGGCHVGDTSLPRQQEADVAVQWQTCGSPVSRPARFSQTGGAASVRFNATLMLETLRGKRMMFVGDSLNRGQYVSMVCLLHRIIPEEAKSIETNGSLTVFRAKDHNATIEFYWAPLLLESNADDAVVHRVSDRIVRSGSINKHGRHWRGVDILVFNTYIWWLTKLKLKILQGSFDDEVQNLVEMSTEDAYRFAMNSMMRWVEKNMDPKKTRVFFTSMSPFHQKSVDWGGEPNGNCYNQTTMIQDPLYWGSDSRKSIMQVTRQVFNESKYPVMFLNITQLSSYRKDAHTSIYKKQWNPLTPEQLANPVSYSDCIHWCLPGLQDTWNELLFAKLFYP